MAAISDQNVEHLTLVQFTDTLTLAISAGPLRVANKLLEKGLISQEQLEAAQQPSRTSQDKASVIVSGVRTQVQLKRENFHVFLSTLQSSLITSSSGSIVKDIHKQYTENRRKAEMGLYVQDKCMVCGDTGDEVQRKESSKRENSRSVQATSSCVDETPVFAGATLSSRQVLRIQAEREELEREKTNLSERIKEKTKEISLLNELYSLLKESNSRLERENEEIKTRISDREREFDRKLCEVEERYISELHQKEEDIESLNHQLSLVNKTLSEVQAHLLMIKSGQTANAEEVKETVLLEAEARAQAAEKKAREAKRREEAAMARAQEAERKHEQALELLRKQVTTQAEHLARSEERMLRLQQLERQWVVERREIEVMGPELGRGAWATVLEAKFRGVRVAAKVIHGQILSAHNQQLFVREMNMASRIRHPNLVQFIGATLKGEMVILMELMPTSLRRELEIAGSMSPELASAIGLDVARAINYLHLMRPHPLIHRDISSANVLLEPLPNSSCRAKVSDYGTVNLQQQLSTAGPGSRCYAAPEANDPTQQSPKMDIFSFGALLMEMLAGELPAPEERARLLGMIHHQPLLALIRECLRINKEDRPSASEVIVELDP